MYLGTYLILLEPNDDELVPLLAGEISTPLPVQEQLVLLILHHTV